MINESTGSPYSVMIAGVFRRLSGYPTGISCCSERGLIIRKYAVARQIRITEMTASMRYLNFKGWDY